MKFYSDVTRSFYETEEACIFAEAQFKKAEEEKKKTAEKIKNERAVRAKEIESAFTELKEADKKYQTLVKKFVEDYGSYHMTYKDENSDVPMLSIFEPFRSWLF